MQTLCHAEKFKLTAMSGNSFTKVIKKYSYTRYTKTWLQNAIVLWHQM